MAKKQAKAAGKSKKTTSTTKATTKTKMTTAHGAASLPLFTYTEYCQSAELVSEQQMGWAFLLGTFDEKKIKQIVDEHAQPWQKANLLKKEKEFLFFSGVKGPVWILGKKEDSEKNKTPAVNVESVHAWYRDHAGQLLTQAKNHEVQQLQIQVHKVNREIERAVLLGLNLAAYHYKNVGSENDFKDFPICQFTKKIDDREVNEAQALARAMNCARHLVNLPANLLNPQTYSLLVKETLEKLAKTAPARGSKLAVDIWQRDRLEKEGMGLHLGVGQGSPSGPCLVHISYRPANKGPRAKKPIALVGKGITFDTGGLDIKPSSGMRMMKKDMGGSAATFALALWAVASGYSRSLDLYLALAENSVDGNSMRPGDVLVARNGLQVEIHNTDAEGRLVLADALDVAVTRKDQDEPEMVLNFATLTGACRVALGTDLAGLFSNHDKIAEDLYQAGLKTGDLNWRLPLFSKYTSGFNSNFADVVNATDGMGGAITAALFLQKFVGEKPWAHLDTYAWSDKTSGALTFAGGNAQPVQAVVEFLRQRK